MTPERWRQITGVFHDAAARDTAARLAFLDDACAGDAELRGEVDRLLRADRDAKTFGESPMGSALDATLPVDAPAASPAARHSRFTWLVWASAIVVAAIFTYAAAILISERGRSTSIGWTYAPQGGALRVSAVDPGGPATALQRGDRVVSINGKAPLGPLFDRRRHAAGRAYDVVIERGGVVQSFRFTAVEGETWLGYQLTFFFVSAVWCVVGLIIGVARPDRTLARVGWLSAIAVGIVFLQVNVLRIGPIFQPLHVVLGYHFFLRFPDDAPPRGLWRWSLVFCYLTLGAFASINTWIHLLLLSQGVDAAVAFRAANPQLFGWQALLLLAYPMSVCGMLVALPVKYRRLTDEDSRRRVRLVVYASIVGLAPQIWWTLVDTLDRVSGPTGLPRFALITNAMTVIVPVAVAYAVVQHQMFDIRIVVRRGLQYLLARRALHAAVALPILALVFTMARHRDLTIGELTTGTWGYLFWVAAAGTVLRFRSRIQRWLDRRFFREQFDRDELVLGILDDVRRVESLSQLSQLVSGKLESALHPSGTFVWYREPEELASAAESDPLTTPSGFPSDAAWLDWLEDRQGAVACPIPAEAPLSPTGRKWLTDRRIALIVPVADTADRLVGALLLGEKKSEQPYSTGDQRLLTAIAQQAAVVRENLRLRARVDEDARVRHDVLARLDSSLANLLKECPACGTCFEGHADTCDRDGQRLSLPLPVPRTIDGRYRLDQSIGQGGMGAVYRARDLKLERPVAVKVLLGRAFGNRGALRRFRREARAAARLNHPNIVSVHDVGVLHGEGAYLVMELVEGTTLRVELERVRVLAPQVAAEWFDRILDGVAAAHAAGIVHRDLKPENVMSCHQESGSLNVKILDLGLVKIRDLDEGESATMTREGQVMGTLGYMSPEQLAGSDVDHRADLFAIGVMVAEALTGRRPFGNAKTARGFDAPWRFPDRTPEARALGQLLQRCLALDARERVSSAAALKSELIPLLRSCPSLAISS